MSILITDMEMPIQCASCRLFSLMPFRGKNKDVCMAMYRLLENPYQRPDWCPLVEVPAGHWISEPGKIPKCSKCGRYSDDADTGDAKFCPFCGARMGKE